MASDLTTIRVLADPVQAEMYQDILAQEGIVAMIPGTQHRAMLGMVGGFIEIPVKVPTADAERAAEILAAIEGQEDEPGDAAAPADELGPAGWDDEEVGELEEEEGPPRRKLRRIAFFIAYALPGGGHFYVGRPVRGLLILLGQIMGLGWIGVHGELLIALVWGLGIALSDAVGASSYVAEVNGDPPPPRLRRVLARGFPALVLLFCLAIYGVVEAAPRTFAGAAGKAACQRLRQCTGQPLAQCELRIARGRRKTVVDGDVLRECASCLKKNRCEDLGYECGSLCVRAAILLPGHRASDDDLE